MNMPERVRIANLPTRIDKLDGLSGEYGKNIYIKRDDQTGTEVSGNKVRKLEFALKEALDMGCDHLITCGGIQSNHARATAAVAAKFGLRSSLVLQGDRSSILEGNYFFDKLLGADVIFVSSYEYENQRMEIMESLKSDLERAGQRPYILPEGASNGIGSFGYINAMEEILSQEEELGIKFDAIVVTTGSGGTYTGLVYGNKLKNNDAKIYCVNVSANEDYFASRTFKLFNEINEYTKLDLALAREEIRVLDGYVGLGYALSRQEEIDFIKEFARKEAIILDPVYTGKAMFGFVKELEKGSFKDHENILFIHTGGIFGWNENARSMI